MKLAELLKDSAYKLTQFTQEQIETLVAAITTKMSEKAVTPYVVYLVRKKAVKLTPEEAVRHLYDMVLRDDLGYPGIFEKDLLGLLIPKIPKAVQKEISTLVRESFTLKAKSKQLLEVAKCTVEIVIEQDEAAGMAYLKGFAVK